MSKKKFRSCINEPKVKKSEPRVMATTENKPFTLANCKNKLLGMFCKPEIEYMEFTPYAWAKINCYINLVGDLEVTGFAKLEEVDDVHMITDVKILKQVVESAYVECNPEAIGEFMQSLPPAERKSGCWKLDWHSHVNMGTTPSGTDWDNYEVMFDVRRQKPFPFMIINKKQKITSELYMGDKLTLDINVTIPDEHMTIEEFEAIYEECSKDVAEKCTKKAYVAPPARQMGFHSGSEDKFIGNNFARGIEAQEKKAPLTTQEQYEEQEYEFAKKPWSWYR